MSEPDRPADRADLWLGIVIGLLAALPLFFLSKYTVLEDAGGGILVAGLVAVGAAIGFLCVVLVARYVFRRVAGKERPSISTTIESVREAAAAVAERRARDAVDHAGQAALDVAAAYSWLTLRSWVAGIALGALALFAGSVTTLLLFEQNAILAQQRGLLETQNERLQAQVDLATEQLEQARRQSVLMEEQSRLAANQLLTGEAQRRLPLYARLSDVVARIGVEATGAAPEASLRDGLVVLSGETAAEVTFLAGALRPYHYADGEARAARAARADDPYGDLRISEDAPLVFASYERGLLFQALTQSAVDLDAIGRETDPYIDFRQADLRGVELRPPLPVVLDACDLDPPLSRRAHGYPVENANLAGAQFQGAVLSDIDFRPLPPRRGDGASLGGADFSGAELLNVDLPVTRAGLVLRGARLSTVKLSFVHREPGRIDIDGAEVANLCLDSFRPLQFDGATGPFAFETFKLRSDPQGRSLGRVEHFLVSRMGFAPDALGTAVEVEMDPGRDHVVVRRIGG